LVLLHAQSIKVRSRSAVRIILFIVFSFCFHSPKQSLCLYMVYV
jgi:hypothetical protein